MINPEEALEENQSTIDKLVLTMHKKLGTIIPHDDIVQAAYEGFLKACKKYTPKRGAAFKTYLWIRMHGSVIDEVRRQTPMGKASYKQGHRALFTEYEEYKHAIPVEMEVFEGKAFKEIIKPIKCNKTKTILELYYINGLNLREIAVIYGCDQSRICQLHRAAIIQLQKVNGVSNNQ